MSPDDVNDPHPIPGVEIHPPANPITRTLLLETDWASTPVGPRDAWPPALRSTVDLILEMPTPAIVFWGDDQTQIYNDGYAAIMGPRHPEFFGGRYRESWPDTYPLIYPWMRRVLDRGETVTVERSQIMLTRFGFAEEAYFTFTFSPVRDGDGTIRGIFQPVVEVTREVIAERRAATLPALIAQIEAHVADDDRIQTLRVDELDTPFAAVFLRPDGGTGLETVARTGNLVGRDDALTGLRPAVLEAFDTNRAVEIDGVDELLGMHAGPWPEPVTRAIAVPLREAPKGPIGVAVVGLSARLEFGDDYRAFVQAMAGELAAAFGRVALRQSEGAARAELVVANEAIRTRTAKLEEANRRKDEFLAMLAHELRNPLGPILVGAELIQADATSTEQRRRASEVIERQTRHLVRLVDDLLDVARIMQGKVRLNRRPGELKPLVDHALDATRAVIRSRRQELHVDVPEIGLPVEADEIRMTQVIDNLVNNAAKFTPEGGSIWIRGLRSGDEVVLEVRDNGAGMAPELLPDVFDFFVQGEAGLDRSRGGLGIGLTLVRQLVRLHGGDVSAHSGGIGQGSTFRVSLPAASSAVDPVSDVSGIGQRTGQSWRSLRIVIVDDNTDMAETMSEMLAMDGHDVRAAVDGPSGLELVEAFRPAVVLCDIGLPGMDGYEIARELRQRHPGLVLVALTGYGHTEARQAGAQAGFDHYLVKPVDFATLAEVLQTVRPAAGGHADEVLPDGRSMPL